jgi:hypothetical protein
MFSLYLLFWKYKNSLQNYPQNKFIFIFVSSVKHISISTIPVFSFLEQ